METFENTPVFEIKNLQKSFGDHAVLKDISFGVNRGDVISVIGPSGSGKSTMLRCINLLEDLTGGSILYHGVDIRDKSVKLTEYRAKVGMVFQSFNLFNNMTALQNCVKPQTVVLKRGKAEATKIALEYLEKVGMGAYVNAKPAQLSGGQKQRVAIAGVMAMKPRCIVLDEPTAMLDPNGRREVIKTVHELNRQEGITVVLITHYMEEVIDADRVVVIDGGHVVMDGTPKEVFSRVKELKKYSLDVPQVTELADELKEAGMDLPYGILSIDELVDELVPLLK